MFVNLSTIRRIVVMMTALTAIIASLHFSQSVHAANSTVPIVWTPLARGIEYALVSGITPDRQQGRILITRIQPSAVLFRVYYQPGVRKTIQQWAAEMPSAVVITNANFFRGNGLATGFVKVDGKLLSSVSTWPDNGKFEITGEVPTISRIIPATTEATPNVNATPEPYSEGIEGHPVLILNGSPVWQPRSRDFLTRRSIIAQDNQGRILVINTGTVEISMTLFTDWLLKSGLGIVNALNLDGGSSSQVYLNTSTLGANNANLSELSPIFQRGLARVPVVLAVYPR